MFDITTLISTAYISVLIMVKCLRKKMSKLEKITKPVAGDCRIVFKLNAELISHIILSHTNDLAA